MVIGIAQATEAAILLLEKTATDEMRAAEADAVMEQWRIEREAASPGISLTANKC